MKSVRSVALVASAIVIASLALAATVAVAQVRTTRRVSSSALASGHTVKKLTNKQVCGLLTKRQITALLNGRSPGSPITSPGAIPACSWEHGMNLETGISVSPALAGRWSCQKGTQTLVHHDGWVGCWQRSTDLLDAQEGHYEVQISTAFNQGVGGHYPDLKSAIFTAATAIFHKLPS